MEKLSKGIAKTVVVLIYTNIITGLVWTNVKIVQSIHDNIKEFTREGEA